MRQINICIVLHKSIIVDRYKWNKDMNHLSQESFTSHINKLQPLKVVILSPCLPKFLWHSCTDGLKMVYIEILPNFGKFLLYISGMIWKFHFGIEFLLYILRTTVLFFLQAHPIAKAQSLLSSTIINMK